MTAYPKQLHQFPYDDAKNPDGPITAWVYNGINDPIEPYANYIIEETDGKYMLQLERDSFIDDDLAPLEARLFEWMEGEGVVPKEEGGERTMNLVLTERILRAPRSLGGYYYHLEPGTRVFLVKDRGTSLLVSAGESIFEDTFEVRCDQVTKEDAR